MVVYIVETPTSNMPNFNVVHYEMFHGQATRNGLRLALPIPFFRPLDGYFPLEIVRTGSFVPDVFSPIPTLVVSRRVQDELVDLPNIKFQQVKFVRLFKEVFFKGDFNYPRDCDVEEILDRFPNAPELFDGIGAYYEVIYPTLTELFEPSDDDEPRLKLLDAALVDKYPILWDDETILGEVAYKRLAKYLDKDFLPVRCVEICGGAGVCN